MSTLQKLEELIYQSAIEAALRSKEFDREMKETRQSLKETGELIRALQQETDRQMRRTDVTLDRLTRQVSGITDSLGLFAEQTVFPAVDRLLKTRAINIKELYAGLKGRRNGDNVEFDIVGAGPEAAILVEVKLKLKKKDVEDLIAKMPDVFKFFPHLRRSKLYGGAAGMSIEKDVERFAYKRGIFVFGESGDNIRILNDEKFKPRTFTK